MAYHPVSQRVEETGGRHAAADVESASRECWEDVDRRAEVLTVHLDVLFGGCQAQTNATVFRTDALEQHGARLDPICTAAHPPTGGEQLRIVPSRRESVPLGYPTGNLNA